MEDTAFGVLGWKSEDWNHRPFSELMTAYRGHLKQREIIRMQIYYSISPHVDRKKNPNFSPEKIILPGDPPKPIKKAVGNRIKLTKEEFIDEYRKSGFEPSQELIKMRFPDG